MAGTLEPPALPLAPPCRLDRAHAPASAQLALVTWIQCRMIWCIFSVVACVYHNRVVVSWRPINKAPCERVHGLTFDVRSLILMLNFTEEGFDKEPALLPVVCGFYKRNSLDWVFPVQFE